MKQEFKPGENSQVSEGKFKQDDIMEGRNRHGISLETLHQRGMNSIQDGVEVRKSQNLHRGVSTGFIVEM